MFSQIAASLYTASAVLRFLLFFITRIIGIRMYSQDTFYWIVFRSLFEIFIAVGLLKKKRWAWHVGLYVAVGIFIYYSSSEVYYFYAQPTIRMVSDLLGSILNAGFGLIVAVLLMSDKSLLAKH